MLRYAAILIVAISLTACASLPKNIQKTETSAIEPAWDTRVGKGLQQDVSAHNGLSGFYLLPSDMDAYVARAVLIEAADRTLDLQYYIVSNDQSVGYLIEKIISAADRGVRVRLLFDDLGTGLTDSQLWLLDSHPNIDVRLFNPKGSLRQLNHRMHNKTFIVDNVVGIVGGRNLADEYFGVREDSNFADMDVMAAGLIARDISKSFDLYWNSKWAVPYEYLSLSRPGDEELKKSWEDLKEANKNAINSKYAVSLRESDFMNRIINKNISYCWARGYVLYDLPEKVSEKGSKKYNVNLMAKLLPLAVNTKSELILVSPYFVPNQTIVDVIGLLRSGGIKVKIATNSLASTDVASVHSGYAKYRKALLEDGVELFEMRADPSEKGRENRKKAMGSYKGSLHAKFYVYDRKAIFIGSRNLDSRSRDINTEIGIFIDSPEVASRAAKFFDATTGPEYCYILSLDKDSKLVWTTDEGGREVNYYKDPDASCWRRFSSKMSSFFIPESQL